jgi:hypothetical protein
MDECCIAAAVLAPQNTEIKENLSAIQFNRLKLSARLCGRWGLLPQRRRQLPNSWHGCTVEPGTGGGSEA